MGLMETKFVCWEYDMLVKKLLPPWKNNQCMFCPKKKKTMHYFHFEHSEVVCNSGFSKLNLKQSCTLIFSSSRFLLYWNISLIQSIFLSPLRNSLDPPNNFELCSWFLSLLAGEARDCFGRWLSGSSVSGGEYLILCGVMEVQRSS